MHYSRAGESGPLWAITCYFNPIGYQRRLANYHKFKQNLTVPLVTVELTHGESFQLGADDADILIQLRGGDVLWQKERLLNIALRAVPEACDAVAWLDCDLIFQDNAWAAGARELLDQYALIQLFNDFHDLPRDADITKTVSACPVPTRRSIVALLGNHCSPEDDWDVLTAAWRRKDVWGAAWAARRELLEAHGLYDACVLGGGDTALAAAACGQSEYAVRHLQMTVRHAEHYQEWAGRFSAAVQGRWSFVDQAVLHLWHGARADRQYAVRHEKLKQSDFDPRRDLQVADNGCYRWASDKPRMHQSIRNYFAARNEDGSAAIVGGAN